MIDKDGFYLEPNDYVLLFESRYDIVTHRYKAYIYLSKILESNKEQIIATSIGHHIKKTIKKSDCLKKVDKEYAANFLLSNDNTHRYYLEYFSKQEIGDHLERFYQNTL